MEKQEKQQNCESYKAEGMAVLIFILSLSVLRSFDDC